MSWAERLARPEIVALAAYEHAAWLPEHTRLHANELPWRQPADATRAGLNRYPEPQPQELVARLAALYAVPPGCLLVTRGSDEAIDLLARVFCRAGEDAVLVCTPTFGMYSLAASIQGARVIDVPLRSNDFSLDAAAVIEHCTPRVKVVFLCSPNNPSGNLLSAASVLDIACKLAGGALVVVDEAYVEFADTASLAQQACEVPGLVVLRTLSKAHALAGARCGAVIAAPEVIALLVKVMPPYAIPQLTVEYVLDLTTAAELAELSERIAIIKAERERMARRLAACRSVERVWPSAANFLLVDFITAESAGRALGLAGAAGLLIRDVRRQRGLARALRISIGTTEQNERLLEALQ